MIFKLLEDNMLPIINNVGQNIQYFTKQKCLVHPAGFGLVYECFTLSLGNITTLFSVVKRTLCPMDSFPPHFYFNLKIAKFHQQLTLHTSRSPSLLLT